MKPLADHQPFSSQGYVAAFLFACMVLLYGVSSASARPQTEPAQPQTNPSAATAVVPRQLGNLNVGKPVEHELQGGGIDVYRIKVKKGKFVRVLAEQKWIDVVIEIVASDGKVIVDADTTNGNWGPEPASLITDFSGTYEVRIKSTNQNVPPGKYEVTVTDVRKPQPQDQTRIAAEHKMFDAKKLNEQGDTDSKKKALEEYQDALALWQSIGDKYEQGLILQAMGAIDDDLGDRQKALDTLALALPLQRAATDRDGEAASLTGIGGVYYHLGEMQQALDYFGQALPVYRTFGDLGGEAGALSGLGEVNFTLGNKETSLDDFNQALLLWRQSGNRDGEAEILNNIGRVYDTLGEKQKALDYYAQALSLVRELGDRYGEAILLDNIGAAYDALGEKQKALDYYGRSLPLLHSFGDPGGEATILGNIGHIYSELAERQKALDYYEQALPLLREAGSRDVEAITLNNIGMVEADFGDNAKALDYYQRALPLATAVGDADLEGTTLDNIGRAYADLGDRQNALEYSGKALPLLRKVGDRDGQAMTLENIADVNLALGNKQEALGALTEALLLTREVKDPLGEGLVLKSLMSYWRAQNKPTLAIFFGKEAVDCYQQIRQNIQGLEKEAQHSFVKSKESVYRTLAELLISEGRLPEAQQVLDLLKDQEYLDFVRQNSRGAATPPAPSMTASESDVDRKFQEISDRVTTIANKWAVLHAKPSRTTEEDQQLAGLDAQLKVANQEWNQFLDGIRTPLGETEHTQASASELRDLAGGMKGAVSQLDSGTVALYTLVGDAQYSVILVTPDVVVAREYPISAAELRKKVLAFREELKLPAGNPLPMAQDLYKILVGPVEQDLKGANATTLLWSLDDVLRYVPMAALNDGSQYLVEKYQNVVFTPLNVNHLADRPVVKNWLGLGMGVSKAYGDFPALPSVPAELEGVIRSQNTPQGVVPGEILLDDAFTVESMKKALEQNPPLVHIASHFSLDPGNDTSSFLLLGGAQPQGAHLSLADLRDDPAFDFAQTQLLTLSACDTAVGSTAGDGREVDGLGDVAHEKGAQAVLASLWDVNDASTGLLMQDLYRLWTTPPGMSKAEALRRAQLDLLHGTSSSVAPTTTPAGANAPAPAPIASRRPPYASPYYWAPFVLIGNPR